MARKQLWALAPLLAAAIYITSSLLHISMLPEVLPHPALRPLRPTLPSQPSRRFDPALEAAPKKDPPDAIDEKLAAYSEHTRHLLRPALLRSANQTNSVMVLRPEGGLSNRMRAVASARAYAVKTRRGLIVIWLQDAHCRAAYHDLFHPDDGLHVIKESVATTLFPSQSWYVRDILREAVDGGQNLHDAITAPLAPPSNNVSMYVRSNLPLTVTPALEPRAEREAWRAFVPSGTVEVLVRNMSFSPHGTLPIEDRIGVHIRSVGNLSLDVPGIESAGSLLGIDAMRHYEQQRSSCNAERFVSAMRHEINIDPNARFYVAADSEATLQAIRTAFNDPEGSSKGLIWTLAHPLVKQCDGPTRRGAQCQQVALVDQMLLSKTKLLLRSSASSFSDAAISLGRLDMKVASPCEAP